MKNLLTLILLLSTVIFSCKKEDCEKPDDCSLKPNAGLCEAYITKYYYDAEAGKCKEFIWGGCDGVVPFETLEACYECECSKQLK